MCLFLDVPLPNDIPYMNIHLYLSMPKSPNIHTREANSNRELPGHGLLRKPPGQELSLKTQGCFEGFQLPKSWARVVVLEYLNHGSLGYRVYIW